jgi:hypothetical protein
MLRIEATQGGPFDGLPTFTLTLEEGETCPAAEAVLLAIAPYTPPIARFTIVPVSSTAYESTSALLNLVQELHRAGLFIRAVAYNTVYSWMSAVNEVLLFTTDYETRERANIIVFRGTKPPARWRPMPYHLATQPILYWWPRSGALNANIAVLPTGMRLWADYSEAITDA